MTQPGFYAADADEQILINLFNGWGYNFYRAENQLRADDLMVRGHVGEMLGTARAAVEAAEADFRRTHLPPPTREHPRPDPEAVRGAQAIEAICKAIGALEGQIRALPVPENDRMTERLRSERDTLEKLLKADRALVATARALRILTGKAGDILAKQDEIVGVLAALSVAVQSRRDLAAAPD